MLTKTVDKDGVKRKMTLNILYREANQMSLCRWPLWFGNRVDYFENSYFHTEPSPVEQSYFYAIFLK